jgi:lactoylglutathione lyase
MTAAAKPDINVKQVVPFFRIPGVDRSIRFYMHGLGFTMKHRWLVDEKLRWCWL